MLVVIRKQNEKAMIKFFRRIRQKLINEGNLKRYLIYAAGEVLLVMIGILLALQVNNWNETRKTKILNKSLLLSIKKDLKLDIEQIEFNEKYLNSYENAGINVRNFLDNKSANRASTQLEKDFMRLQLFREFSPTKTAYDNLLNSGIINLIKNENVTRLLATYHYEPPFHKRSKDQRNRLANDYDPYRIKYTQSGMLRDYLKEQIFSDSTFSSRNYEVDWKNLREDKEYRYLLDQIIAMRIPARWRLVKARQDIDELLSEIDKEISGKEE